MKIIKYSLLLVLSMALGLTSCTEDPAQPAQEPEVSFNFNSPAPGTMFSLGDTVHIHGTIAYEPGLHGYMVQIINTSHSDTVVFSTHKHDHGESFMIHEIWVNNVMHHSDMTLKVTALITHEGTEVNKEIPFHCHPM